LFGMSRSPVSGEVTVLSALASVAG